MNLPEYNNINKRDNKILYVFDKGIDKFVLFVINVCRLFIPSNFKEKFDKLTEHKDMLHNIVGLSFFNIIGGLCMMATQIKLANFLGVAIYGIYSYCLAIGEVGAMFVRYGRNKTLLRDLVQYPEKRDKLVVCTFFLSLINLLIFLTVTFMFHKSLDIKISWTYFLLILTPCLASLTLDPVYESLHLMSWSAIYSLLQKFIFFIVIWGLLLINLNVTLVTIGIIILLSWLIIYSVQYYEVITQLRINFIKKVKIKDLWDLYKENFVIFLSCVVGVAFGPLIRVMLNNYEDSTSVGIYAAGLQIYNICLFFNVQISRVGNPMMAQVGHKNCSPKKRCQLVLRYTLIMLATSIPLAMPMLIFPKFITNLFFSEEYSTLANYLPFLAFYLVAISLGVVFMQFLISMRKDKTYFTIFTVAAIVTSLFAYYFIPKYGLLGAFISLTVPHGIACVFYMICSLKYLKYKRV